MNFTEIIHKLQSFLDRLKIEYMLVGGMAINYYGLPRATFDIDISLILSKEDVERFIEAVDNISRRSHFEQALSWKTEGYRGCHWSFKEAERGLRRGVSFSLGR